MLSVDASASSSVCRSAVRQSSRRVVDDVDGLLPHVGSALCRGEDVGHCYLDWQVMIEEIQRLYDRPRVEVVFGGDHIRPMLREEPFRKEQSVAF